MAIIALPSLLNITLFTGGLYSIYCICWELTIGAPRRRLRKKNGCAPAKTQPSYDPILGLDLLWEGYTYLKQHNILESSLDRFKKLNVRTYQITLLRQEIIVTMEPLNVKTMLSLDFKNWSVGEDRKKYLAPFIGEGIFTTDGAAWQHSRNMLRPSFVRTQIEDLDIFERHFNQLNRAIPHDGSTVDLQGFFFGLTLDIATEFLFGESTNSLTPDGSSQSIDEFVEAFTYCSNIFEAEDSVFGPFDIFLPNRRFNRSCKIVHGTYRSSSTTFRTQQLTALAFVDSLVEKALVNRSSHTTEEKRSGTRYVFLDELLTQTTDRIRIRSECLNILGAGRDTTASLLSNLLFEISRRPDVWSNLQKEVDALSGSQPSYGQLKNMKYLRALINESLRLYPVAPENSRQAIADTFLPVGGGKDETSPVFITKGQIVGWSLYAMHRRKDFYGEDADIFRPERWLDHGDVKGLRVEWEYLPFNGGPRICLGRTYFLISC